MRNGLLGEVLMMVEKVEVGRLALPSRISCMFQVWNGMEWNYFNHKNSTEVLVLLYS